MNNITSNPPSFGAKLLFNDPHQMLKVMEEDARTTKLDDEMALKIFDSFEKMHPEDVIEVSNLCNYGIDSDMTTLSKLMVICNPRLKYPLEFKNLRTNQTMESSRNFFETMKDIVENYNKIFEKE